MSWLISVLFSIFVANVVGQTNMTSYRKLPPLYTFHNYEESLARQLPSTYCLVFAQIQPDNHSELWHSIESISKDSQHRYRHDYLFFGLCVEKCREILKNSINPLENKLLDGNVPPHNEVTDYYRRVFAPDPDDSRLRHHDLLSKCVNYEFQQKYNLTASTFVEYCDTAGQDLKIDYLEVIAYTVIACLVFSNIFSSVYDYYLKRQQISPKHQHKDHQEVDSLGSSMLTSFSITRNYKKIVSSNNDSDMQFTYFFRFFTSCIVMLGHFVMIASAMPLTNPEFLENNLYRPYTIIFQNGSTLLQIFFVLTGFQLKVKFDQQKPITRNTGYRTSIFIYFLVCIQRFLSASYYETYPEDAILHRNLIKTSYFSYVFGMLPSLCFVMLFNATLLTRLGHGPIWRHMVQAERTFCRRNWWKNIFMINNFMLNDSCVHQTWYLATDTHLNALYSLVLIVTAKFPRTKKPLYILLGILAFIVPGVLTYIYRLKANAYLSPEYYRYLYFKDNPTIHISYAPPYCNLGGYLVGIVCAEIYQSQRFKEIKAAVSKYTKNQTVQLPYVVITLCFGFGLLFTGLFVINRKTDEPSILMALYAGCYRNIWAIFGGFSILAFLVKFGGIAYDMCCSGISRILGRITFQMFMWHVLILHVLYGNYRQTLHVSTSFWVGQTILVILLSIVVGFIMTLFVEYPTGNIINILFKHALKPKESSSRAKASKTK